MNIIGKLQLMRMISFFKKVSLKGRIRDDLNPTLTLPLGIREVNILLPISRLRPFPYLKGKGLGA